MLKLTVSIVLLLLIPPLAAQPDLILKNGRVWTGRGRPFAEAVAITGSKIRAVGANRTVLPMAGPSTRVVDLAGRFVMPGINDAHIHFLGGSARLSELDLNDARSLEEIQVRLRGFAAEHPQAAWIRGYGWQYAVMPGGRLPTRQDIDKVIADRPVYLSAYDGHTGWANSKALQVAGVKKESIYSGFGEIVRDPDGEPTGVLKEGAQSLVRRVLPRRTPSEELDSLRKGVRMAAGLGITSLTNAGGSEADFGPYLQLLDAGELTIRVSQAISIGPEVTGQRISQIAEMAGKYSGDRFRVSGVKIVVDGVIEAHTAALLSPYADQKGTAGKPSYTQEQLDRAVAMADQAGLQVLIHAIGDRGVRMALDAFENAQRVNGRRDSRHRIEHIETIDAADLPRFAQLGVLASMEPIHSDPGTTAVWERALGPERSSRGFAWQSLTRAGARLVFSSDWPAAITPSPLRGLHAAVNRQTIDGKPAGGWLPKERVGREQALEAYTAAGAYSDFQESTKGRLAEGFQADLIVLDADPTQIPPLQIGRSKVVMTIFNGRIILGEAPRSAGQ